METTTKPERSTEFAPNGSRFRIKARCKTCRKVRFVTPLYPTTKSERERMKTEHVCSDCEPTDLDSEAGGTAENVSEGNPAPASAIPDVTREQAEAALEVLTRFGRKGFCDTARVTRGDCIGHAVSHFSGPEVCADAAIEMLEDWNGHLSVALIGAVEKGLGRVERKGRVCTVTLPEHWAQL